MHLKIVVGEQDDLPPALQLCLGVGYLRLVVVASRGREGDVAARLERNEQVRVEGLARARAPAIVGPNRLCAESHTPAERERERERDRQRDRERETDRE